ncbi:MAG: discoidin domain-containing protein [Bacteroidota bacterium]
MLVSTRRKLVYCAIMCIVNLWVFPVQSATPASSTTIESPEDCSISVIAVLAREISCHGLNDGIITTSVSGGTAPFTYSWSNGTSTSGIGSASAGNYTITVTDVQGCEATDQILVSQPSAITLSMEVNNATSNSSNGRATVEASGGTGNISYQWSTGANSATLASLTSGIYRVTASDQNGCSTSANAYVFDVQDCGTVNIARNRPAFSSSNGLSSSANLINDGDAETRWFSQEEDAWVYVDLLASYNVCRVVLSWEAAYASSFDVQVSLDAENWTTVQSIQENASLEQEFFLDDIGRYVRVISREAAFPIGVALWEMEVYGSVEGVINQPPFFSEENPVFFVLENSPEGTLVDNVTAFDLNNDDITYTIESGNESGAFTLNPSTGALSVNSPTLLDFELFQQLSLEISATDNGPGNLFNTTTVLVNIADQDDTDCLDNVSAEEAVTVSASSSSNPASLAIDQDENTFWRSQGAAPQWLEIDLGRNYDLCGIDISWGNDYAADYSIELAQTPGNYTPLLSRTGNTATNTSYTPESLIFGRFIRINCQREILFSNSFSIKEVVISGFPSSDNHAPSISANSFSIQENSPAGTTVGSVSAIDFDGNGILFDILGGNPNQTFSINPVSGEIVVNDPALLDFETTPIFEVLVSAEDDGLGALSSTTTVKISLEDVNEGVCSEENAALNQPSKASSSRSSRFLPENAFDGNLSTSWSTVNRDPQWLYTDLGSVQEICGVTILWGSAYAYQYEVQVSNDAVSWATIASNNRNRSTTVELKELAASGRYVRLLCKRRISRNGYIVREIEVHTVANPENQSPKLDGAVFSIPENLKNTTEFGSLFALDPDDDPLTFSIVDGNLGGAFSINAETGVLSVANTNQLDFERNPSFTLTVQVDDQNVSNNTDDATVIINLTNVAEQACVGTNLSLAGQVVASSSINNYTQAENLADGVGTTRWASGPGNAEWVYIDLGEEATICQTTIRWEDSYATDYRIQLSNDLANWEDIQIIQNNTQQTNTLLGLQGTGRYIRIQSDQAANSQGISIWEWEVFGTASPTQNTIGLASEEGLSIFPNPSEGEVNITFEVSRTQPMLVQIYDLIGNEVFSYEGNALEGTQSLTVPLYHVADGTYIVSVITEDLQSRKKLILQR